MLFICANISQFDWELLTGDPPCCGSHQWEAFPGTVGRTVFWSHNPAPGYVDQSEAGAPHSVAWRRAAPSDADVADVPCSGPRDRQGNQACPGWSMFVR